MEQEKERELRNQAKLSFALVVGTQVSLLPEPYVAYVSPGRDNGHLTEYLEKLNLTMGMY